MTSTNERTLQTFIAKFNADAGSDGSGNGGSGASSALEGTFLFDEPLAPRCTFRVGGSANCLFQPAPADLPRLPRFLAALRDGGIPVFILGGGANLVISDCGIRGVVIDLARLDGFTLLDGACSALSDSNKTPAAPALSYMEENRADSARIVRIEAGLSLDRAADSAAAAGLSGLEFLAGMPGTIGGAVWMNARAYGSEIASTLVAAEILPLDSADGDSAIQIIPRIPGDFAYKRSPFQTRACIITAARFRLVPAERAVIDAAMQSHRADRESKGHFRYPSAGSVFKNNPAFGKPTGALIDSLGLRGLSVGGAQVAPWHGNFIINTGNASASDIRTLIEMLIEKVRAAAGVELECEVIFAGDWHACGA